ncbi:MarR family transcriptional regulator [Streptomyces avidinii]|uniref:MarR family transcriptional regulator n=1 Tax=Streptomyces avidinii TaxID=1895 RepID=UPI00386F35AC|nr:MarR family transcriptional regulator [Streptomyces avidinii]
MEYSHTDAELVRQPIGYWSRAASDAVVSRIRAVLAGIGTTQPQAWILARIAHAGTPPTRDGVTGVLSGYAAAGIDDLDEEIDATVARGWVTQDAEGRLELGPEGKDFYALLVATQAELWQERHRDIPDEEYVLTLKVLQRFIHNTGGRAWHH